MTNPPICNGSVNTTGKYCQRCYDYLKKHPEGLYPLPPKGEVHYAPNGDPICHICGKAIRKLGNHIAFYHKMSQNEYREMFGLYHNTRLSNEDYKDMMRKYNYKYAKVVVNNNLIKGGINTRTDKVILPGKRLNRKINIKIVGDDEK